MDNRPALPIRPGATNTVATLVESETDPTGDLPEYLVTQAQEQADPDAAGWTAGSWSGSWSASTGRVEAVSPSIGSASAHSTPDIELADEGEWVLWCRWSTTRSDPMEDVATILHRW